MRDAWRQASLQALLLQRHLLRRRLLLHLRRRC
eukprot:COSAG05_NODE_21310_length_273_cov_0.454023_1_plen_32_part_01